MQWDLWFILFVGWMWVLSKLKSCLLPRCTELLIRNTKIYPQNFKSTIANHELSNQIIIKKARWYWKPRKKASRNDQQLRQPKRPPVGKHTSCRRHLHDRFSRHNIDLAEASLMSHDSSHAECVQEVFFDTAIVITTIAPLVDHRFDQNPPMIFCSINQPANTLTCQFDVNIVVSYDHHPFKHHTLIEF